MTNTETVHDKFSGANLRLFDNISHIQNWRDASVLAFEEIEPVVPWLLSERLPQHVGQKGVAFIALQSVQQMTQIEFAKKHLAKSSLKCCDSKILAIRTAIASIIRQAATEGRSPVFHPPNAVQWSRQEISKCKKGAVKHTDVDLLALASRCARRQRGKNTDNGQVTTPCIIRQNVLWR
ncbi:hypothetical protein AU467_18790 [Mesorhizobium loti]|uniref:Uncharacterized protein n=1 Tax=Rhizobium loti TaxID=381 RepID=A0A124GGJ9_RHILI|nr:hypothetical protein AU467_18790 [Mesorhizobium loti]